MKLLHFIIALLTIVCSTVFTLLFAQQSNVTPRRCYCKQENKGHEFPTIKSFDHSLIDNSVKVIFHPHAAEYKLNIELESGATVSGIISKSDSTITLAVPEKSYGGGSIKVYAFNHLLESKPF